MKMKKILSFLLIFLLLFCVVSISVNAAEYVQPITLDSNDGLFGWLKEVWYTITDIYDLLTNIRNRIVDTVADAIINGFRGLWDYLDTITDYINTIRNSIVNGLTNAITSGFNGLWNYLNNFDDRLGSVISLLSNAVPDAIKNGISTVTEYLSDLYEQVTVISSLIKNHFTDSFITGFTQIKEYLRDTYEAVLTLSSLIKNHLTDSFVNGLKAVRDYIADTYERVHELSAAVRNGVIGTLHEIGSFINSLPDKILTGIQDILIPDVETLQADLEAAVENITSQFGIHFDTYDRLFDTEIAPEDVVEDYNIPGIGTFKLKFLDTSYLIKGVAFFRPFIRGFLVLLLVFYNWKQALTLFDQNPAIAGSAIQGLSSKGGEPGE